MNCVNTNNDGITTNTTFQLKQNKTQIKSTKIIRYTRIIKDEGTC